MARKQGVRACPPGIDTKEHSMKQDFKRARSAEQKCQRLADIKDATAQLYREFPYHEITLTTIAERLGWSRASLYKYVTTKEEIFLELSADARKAYFDALMQAFPEGCSLDAAEAAKRWAQAAEENRDWFVYGNLLLTIIETNVSLERLKCFKRGYFDHEEKLAGQLCPALGLNRNDFEQLLSMVNNQAVGMCASCANNPLVSLALEELGIKHKPPEFLPSMTGFIEMCLARFA